MSGQRAAQVHKLTSVESPALQGQANFPGLLLCHFSRPRQGAKGKSTKSKQQQGTRFRCLHGRHVNLMLSVGYVPQIPVVPETPAVCKPPGKARKVHDADRTAEGVDAI